MKRILVFLGILIAGTTYSAEPTSCIGATFSATGDQNWKSVVLKLTNNCTQTVDFQNLTVSFQTKTALNTGFWGDFAPLSYPDNTLKITSKSQPNGNFLASLNLHFPSYTGANSKLPVGKSIAIKYGAATDSHIEGTTQVYLDTVVTSGSIKLINSSVRPTNVVQNYALVHISMNGQAISNVQLPWGESKTVPNLAVGNYMISADTVTDDNDNYYSGQANPNIVSVLANQTTNSNISYSLMEPPQTTNGGRIIGYIPGWKTPPEAQLLANAGYTHVMIAFGVFSTSKPGIIVTAFDKITKEYIQSLHQAGIKVLLSLGGALTSIPNTTVNYHQVLTSAASVDAFKQTFINSLNALIAQYNFDGFDIDIEHGMNSGGSFSQPQGDIAALASIINTMRIQSPALLITLTPQVANIAATRNFDSTWGNYAALIMQTYNALDWVGIQLYNTGCAFGIDQVCYGPTPTSSPDFSVAMATDLLADWPAIINGRTTGFQPYISYLKSSQIVLGYPAANATGGSDGSPVTPTTTIKRAVQCLKTAQIGNLSCGNYIPPKAFGDIGGVFNWEVTYDQSNSFKFATELKNCVINRVCD